MKKRPEGEGGLPPDQDNTELRQSLKEKGLTDSQIDDMMIRLNAEDLFESGREPKEPTFFYQAYEEHLGRPLTDIEKIQIKEDLKRSNEQLKKHYGVGDDKPKKN